MIPRHVIDYWREQGKNNDWIFDRINSFLVDGHKTNKKWRDQKVKALFDDGVALGSIAKHFGLHVQTIRRIIRKQNGTVFQPKKIGCSDCATKEHLRGLCIKCYRRWLQRGKPELEIIKPKMKPWEKIKARNG